MRSSFFLSLLVLAACGGATADPGAAPGKPAPPPAASANPPPDAPSAPATWCSGQADHTFCADFDGDYAADGWQVWSGGPLVTVASDRSSPFAFGLQMPTWQDQPPQKHATSLMKQIKHRGPKQIVITFDMRIDGLGLADDSQEISPVALFLATELGSSPYVDVDLQLRAQSASLDVYAVKDDENPDPDAFGTFDAAALPSGKWVRVGLSLSAGDGGATRATLTYDGVPAGSKELAAFDTSLIDSAYVLLGDVGETAHPNDFVAAIDNVVVDVK